MPWKDKQLLGYSYVASHEVHYRLQDLQKECNLNDTVGKKSPFLGKFQLENKEIHFKLMESQ